MFLWFWFIILSVLSGLSLLYRIVTVVVPTARRVLLRAHLRISSQDEINTLVKKLKIGDWFVLYQVGKNIHSLFYKQLVGDLALEFADQQGA